MSTIDRIIWLIESRFRDAVTLEEIASRAGLSRFYVSRLFSMSSGQTVSAYIRHRRLTEAAKSLANGAPDILHVAFDAGYGSHEAFTRAFRDHFGVTPEEIRKSRSVENLVLTEPDRMQSPATVKLDPPKIAKLEPMRLAGLRQRYSMSAIPGIPDQWQRFQPYIGNIGAISGKGAFGVIIEASDDPESFDYMCGVPIGNDPDLPPELTTLDVPAMDIAIFPHRGHVSQIQATCQAIFTHGLSDAGLKNEGPVSFFEYYGDDFDARTGTGTIEIWMHITG